MPTPSSLLKFSLDMKNPQEIVKELGVGAVKAQKIAEVKTITFIKKEMLDEAKSMLALKAGTLKQEFEKRVKFNKGGTSILAQGKQFTLRLFLKVQAPRVDRKKPGLKLKVYKKKGYQIFKGTFAAVGASGNLQVFKRMSKKRSDLKAMSATGIVDMYKQPEFNLKITSSAQVEYDKQFERAARSILKGYIK